MENKFRVGGNMEGEAVVPWTRGSALPAPLRAGAGRSPAGEKRTPWSSRGDEDMPLKAS